MEEITEEDFTHTLFNHVNLVNQSKSQSCC